MKSPKFETLAIKSTEDSFKNISSVSTPIYLSTTFHRNEDGTYNDGFCYSRENNPNRKVLEETLALLENGEKAFAFSSGMAAISAIFQSLKPGDHVLLPDDVYYAIFKLADNVMERWGLEFSRVNMADLDALKNAIKNNTKLIWVESPSNPQLKISDIQAISIIAHENNALCAVDNTWPSPVLQKPLDLGADIVMHSTSKYFGGHSDVIGGAIILKSDNELSKRIHQIQHLSGGVPSPFDCWLICRGIQTMHLRVMTQSKSAFELAQYLANHSEVESVNYPGLASHKGHEIAKKQMSAFGGMLSVLIKGDAKKAMRIAANLEYFGTATSLGGVESLVEHRKSVEGETSLTPQNLLRISVGLENVEDLIEDWNCALSKE